MTQPPGAPTATGERPAPPDAPDAGTFAVRAVAPSRRGARWLAAPIGIALLVAAGAWPGSHDARTGLAAASSPGPDGPIRSPMVDAGPGTPTRVPELVAVRPPARARADGAGVEPATLREPASELVTAAEDGVVVAGRVVVKAAWIRIAIESSPTLRLAEAVIDTANHDGGIRPVRAPTFELELALPAVRPDGRAWLVITAYDERGLPVATMRRPLELEAAAG